MEYSYKEVSREIICGRFSQAKLPLQINIDHFTMPLRAGKLGNRDALLCIPIINLLPNQVIPLGY